MLCQRKTTKYIDFSSTLLLTCFQLSYRVLPSRSIIGNYNISVSLTRFNGSTGVDLMINGAKGLFAAIVGMV